MKTQDIENYSADLFREFYLNCPVEAQEVNGDIKIGRVVAIEHDKLEMLLVSKFTHEGQEPLRWVATKPFTNRIRRISEREYLLYELKGWHLPREIR